MSTKRGSVLIPSDFHLGTEIRPSSESSSEILDTDLSSKPDPSSQATDEESLVQGVNAGVHDENGNDVKGANDTEEHRSRVSSLYYSVASKRTSILSFFTTRSRQTSGSRESRNSYTYEPRTQWQQTLHDKKLVLPKFDETNWSGRGQHVEFDSNDIDVVNTLLVPYGILGHSATAVVEKVLCKRIMLARKKIRCNWRLKREDAIEEVAHLQRLSHAHIVRGVGTYVMGKDLSILLYPATEHNLESFLDEYMELSPERSDKNALLPEEHGIFYQMKTDMNKFPRCLVQAIAFVHERLVKHMDIKPTNLLVQKKIISGASSYQIYLADFGIARSYDTAADAETESRTPFSRTYAAPEVIRQEVRGFPADIFSLGCVVLEIYVALTNKRVELVELRHGNLNGDVSYQANLDAIIDQSRWLSNGYRERYGELYRDISIYETVQKSLEMMHRLPGDRPTAQALASYDAFKPASCCYGGPELFEAEPASKRNQSYLEVVQE